jgi:hypothetical protein
MELKDLANQFRFLGIEEPETIISSFQEAVGSQIKDKSRSGGLREYGDPYFGKFTFMMRSLMMRHSQQMKYVGTSTTLMSLPALTEELLTVEFSYADKAEYLKLETQARASYSSIDRGMVSRSWMKLTASLLPMRIACSGGRLPLETKKKEIEQEGDEVVVEKSHSEAEPSRHAFSSKLKRLIEELEIVRDTEPKCKFTVRRASSSVRTLTNQTDSFVCSESTCLFTVRVLTAVASRGTSQGWFPVPHPFGRYDYVEAVESPT